MTDEQRAELKRLAEAATGGRWSVFGPSLSSPWFRVARVGIAEVGTDSWGLAQKTDAHDICNADFIAAANPAAVLALLAENASLRAGYQEYVDACTTRNAAGEAVVMGPDLVKARLAEWATLKASDSDLCDRLKRQVDATHEQSCRAKAAEAEIQRLKNEAEDKGRERNISERDE